MINKDRITLIGLPPSPYTRKMIALLRYRQIPYQVIWGSPHDTFKNKGIFNDLGIEAPKPALLPTFILPNDKGEFETVTDSTPIIRRLEDDFKKRSVIPENPALCFLNYLLEDFGDEWVTKYMFHYRWHFDEDADNASSILPLHNKVDLADDAWQLFKDSIGSRQIERLRVVGSNDVTAPIIEKSYKRFLKIMENHLSNFPFLFGYRPSSADFAIYGQLTQLIGLDPTSRAIAHKLSLRTTAWVDNMEDMSGLNPNENQWETFETLSENMKPILEEIGRAYVPALLANSRAIENGEEVWETEIDGSKWSQNTFNYQAKCLQWINAEFFSLSSDDQKRILDLFNGTGCEKLLIKEQ